MKYAKLGLFKRTPHIDFFKYTKIFFLLSAFLVIMSFVVPIFKGYNLGIDFKGGIVINFKSLDNYSPQEIKNKIDALSLGAYLVKEFNNNEFQIEMSLDAIQQSEVNDIIEKIKLSLSDYTLLQTQFVGPSISLELVKGGVLAILFSFLGIFAYLWVRYDWQFGIIGIIALVHDVLITLLFLSIFAFEMNIATIAAILTIIGYSINDTVVLFDQVRENVRKYSKETPRSIINRSINQVLSRSIATSVTVFLVLLSIFLLGGSVLKSFSFTLLVGVFFGAYSSICIAVPLLYYIGNLKARHTRKTDGG